MKAPPPAATEEPDRRVVEEALDRLARHSLEMLFDEGTPCMPELRECLEKENAGALVPAAMCYEEWISLPSRQACFPWQQVRAAALYDRAGLRDRAVSLRRELVADFFSPNDVAVRDVAALTVDVADFELARGETERACLGYAMVAALEHPLAGPDEVALAELGDYVEARCLQTGGPCVLPAVDGSLEDALRKLDE